MTERDSLELLVDVRTRGQGELAAIEKTTIGIAQADKQATAAAGVFKQSMDGTAGAVQKTDVGLGQLLDSARRASAELRRVADQNNSAIQSIERQALLSGAKTPQQRLSLQRGFALQDYGKSATDISRINAAFDEMAASLGKAQDGMMGAILKSALLVEAFNTAAHAAKELTLGSAQYAARTETVGVITEQLARVNHLSTGAVMAQADAVKRLGITTQESLNTVNRMIFAQLDVAKATDLARLAQDAARIAGTNSSEALQGIIHGIVTRQPEVLRTYGIVVNFEQEYAKAARERGKELTAAEKVQVAMNVVLEQGTKITGVYAATLLTAGGRLQSMQRHLDEAKNSIGDSFVPAMSTAITWMTKLAKLAEENGQAFATLAGAVTGASLAAGLLALTPVGRGWKIGGTIAGAVIGAATASGDRIQARKDAAVEGAETLEKQRNALNESFKSGQINAESYKQQWAQLEAAAKSFRETLAGLLAQDYEKLYQKAPKKGTTRSMGHGEVMDIPGYPTLESYLPERLEIGPGVAPVTKAELLAARAASAKGGATFDQDRFNREQADAAAQQAAEKAKKAAEAGQKAVEGYLDHISGSIGAITQEFLRADEALKKAATPQQRAAILDHRTSNMLALMNAGLAPEQGRRAFETTRFLYETPLALPSVKTQGVNVDPKANEKAIADIRERALRAQQRYVNYQEQMLRLTAGPGGELSVVNDILRLREDGAYREFAITRDRGKLEADLDQARKDRLISIAQYQRQQLEEYRQAAGQVYDAMLQKGFSGISDVVKGQLQVIGRTLFQNIAVEIFRQAKDTLKLGNIIGGQVDKEGKLTTVGRVLQGTPFGVDLSRVATEQNTVATRENNIITRELNATMQAISNQLGAARGSGGSGGADAVVDGAVDAVAGGKSAGKVQKLLGSIFAIGAGAYGIAQGVHQGGARGALNAGAGAAGMASGLIGSGLLGPALAAGPVGGILAGAALGMTFLGSLFRDSKEKFDREQTEALNRNKYTEPTASNRTTDVSGADVDYDYQGRLRLVASSRPTMLQVNISAMDAKSVLDRSPDIAEALHKELRLGHPVGLGIQQVILGA